MIHQVIFDSISDIPAWVEAHPRAGSNRSSEMRGGRHWDDGISFERALSMAADGGWWEKGAKEMIEATSCADELKREGVASEIEYDVTGHHLDMDEYLSGSPECWERVNDEVEAPVIAVGVQLYTPAGNSHREYLYRGAAIMSVIDDLEAKGVRVELWGCLSGVYRKDESFGIDMRVCLKRADEQWSPSSVAFGLTNAAMGRRIGFRVVEAFRELQTCGYIPGHSLNFSKDRPDGFDVWFGYKDMVDNTYTSVQGALKLVTREIEKQLKDRDYAKIN